jgi:iron complex transport system substrate-binding protein
MNPPVLSSRGILFSLKRRIVNRLLRIVVPVLLSLSLFLVSACGTSSKPTTPASITVTDQLNRTVTLPQVPQRIISIAPANTEILYALGLADRIVAVTDYCNYPPEAKEKDSIGGFSSPNLEKIIVLAPDLVLAAPIHEDQVIPQLENKGITVLALAPKTLDEVLAAISLIGRVTGADSQASQLVNSMQRRIKAVTDKTASLTADQKLKVLFIVWHDPLMASGAGTFHDELIRLAGGVNTVPGEGYPGISLETVIQTDPDVILAGVGMGEGGDAPLVFAKEEARLRNISARQHECVYGVDNDICGRAGPRIVDALEEFARDIHPELFK